MYKFLSVLKVYLIFFSFIVGWWAIAFRPSINKAQTFEQLQRLSKGLDIEPAEFEILGLVSIQRDLLKHALGGDFQLMHALISEWDIDAQMLQEAGYKEIKRLPQKEFLRSQFLGRQLIYRTGEQRQQLAPLNILDDTGRTIDLARPFQRFLPQTYAAASLLLALAPPNEIIALPKLLREQVQLYPKVVTDLIPLDSDRHNAEKLFEARPEIAFVAHYSHPSTLQTLANQGIVIYMMKNLFTLPDIAEELMNIGHLINRQPEAELLKIFIDASMLALDNKKMIIEKHLAGSHAKLPRILFLNYHQSFSIPSPITLTGQLLKRMGDMDISLQYVLGNEKGNKWTFPIDKEHILNLNPDCVIIAAENIEAIEKEIRSDAAFQNLSASKKNQIYFVDEAIQQSPSQYVVLAYHDIIQVLSNLLTLRTEAGIPAEPLPRDQTCQKGEHISSNITPFLTIRSRGLSLQSTCRPRCVSE